MKQEMKQNVKSTNVQGNQILHKSKAFPRSVSLERYINNKKIRHMTEDRFRGLHIMNNVWISLMMEIFMHREGRVFFVNLHKKMALCDEKAFLQ